MRTEPARQQPARPLPARNWGEDQRRGIGQGYIDIAVMPKESGLEEPERSISQASGSGWYLPSTGGGIGADLGAVRNIGAVPRTSRKGASVLQEAASDPPREVLRHGAAAAPLPPVSCCAIQVCYSLQTTSSLSS